MAINLKNFSEKELWEYVAVHLKKKGIDTILVGGAVVSIYSIQSRSYPFLEAPLEFNLAVDDFLK